MGLTQRMKMWGGRRFQRFLEHLLFVELARNGHALHRTPISHQRDFGGLSWQYNQKRLTADKT